VLTFGLSITAAKPLPLSSLAVFAETRIDDHFLATEEANSENAIANPRLRLNFLNWRTTRFNPVAKITAMKNSSMIDRTCHIT